MPWIFQSSVKRILVGGISACALTGPHRSRPKANSAAVIVGDLLMHALNSGCGLNGPSKAHDRLHGCLNYSQSLPFCSGSGCGSLQQPRQLGGGDLERASAALDARLDQGALQGGGAENCERIGACSRKAVGNELLGQERHARAVGGAAGFGHVAIAGRKFQQDGGDRTAVAKAGSPHPPREQFGVTPQQLAGRAAVFHEPGEGRSDPVSGLFDSGDRDRGLSEREIVVERALRRAADLDNFVETGARITLPPEQGDGCVDDRLPVFGNGGHFVLQIILIGLHQPLTVKPSSNRRGRMQARMSYVERDGVASIVLDDGKVNVMSAAMLDDIAAALDRAEKGAEIVVLRSTRPGIFSAGFDLKTFAAGDVEKSLVMVKAGAELALRLMAFPLPTIGVMEGHAFPMGTFLLLSCDVRLAARGPHRMGLNEVAIGIAPPGFSIELARSRLHPSWLSRTVTTGEMYEPDDALVAGLLDRVVPPAAIEAELGKIVAGLRAIHKPSHAIAKKRLRQPAMEAMRAAIDRELTLEAYQASSKTRSAVVLPR